MSQSFLSIYPTQAATLYNSGANESLGSTNLFYMTGALVGAVSPGKGPFHSLYCRAMETVASGGLVVGIVGGQDMYDRYGAGENLGNSPWAALGGATTALGGWYKVHNNCKGPSGLQGYHGDYHGSDYSSSSETHDTHHDVDVGDSGGDSGGDGGADFSSLEKIGWATLGAITLLGAGALILSPFDGPAGEYALGTASFMAFANAGVGS